LASPPYRRRVPKPVRRRKLRCSDSSPRTFWPLDEGAPSRAFVCVRSSSISSHFLHFFTFKSPSRRHPRARFRNAFYFHPVDFRVFKS
jgi:hypothetical protein